MSYQSPRVAILHAPGTNRDHDAALAVTLAGGTPEILHLTTADPGALASYAMVVLPGGFSYGDDLGAGRVWALELDQRFGVDFERFVASGKPVIGICNGFQALVRLGVLPGAAAFAGLTDTSATPSSVALTHNASGRFECRWVTLDPVSTSRCTFTRGLSEPILCPVAHGEGRLVTTSPSATTALIEGGYVALTYATDSYPDNPNGSVANIAALTNAAGNVLGLMPHPENHVLPVQRPTGLQRSGGLGLALFKAALS